MYVTYLVILVAKYLLKSERNSAQPQLRLTRLCRDVVKGMQSERHDFEQFGFGKKHFELVPPRSSRNY
jgi:hypothetical protein